jgi:hypothetical protein
VLNVSRVSSSNPCSIATNSSGTRASFRDDHDRIGTLIVRTYLSDGSDGNPAGSIVVGIPRRGYQRQCGIALSTPADRFRQRAGLINFSLGRRQGAGQQWRVAAPSDERRRDLVAGTNLTIIPTSNGTIISSDTEWMHLHNSDHAIT